MKTSAYTIAVLTACSSIFAQNIDATYKYAYGENVGWLNFKPIYGPGVTVTDSSVSGYLWAENIGWINLKPTNYGGVINNGIGELSGYAWGENVGWINFNPTVPGDTTDQYRVRIDTAGNFEGWAWGENIGWIHLASPTSAYKVKTSWITSCRVDLNDLASFCTYWLSTTNALSPADFVKTRQQIVDFRDFAVFAYNWMNYCPYAWPWRD